MIKKQNEHDKKTSAHSLLQPKTYAQFKHDIYHYFIIELTHSQSQQEVETTLKFLWLSSLQTQMF